MSEARRSKRGGDTDLSRARSRSDSLPSSSAKRKSSQKTDPDRDRGASNPTSRSFSSTTPSTYPAAPSVASSYATANTTNPTNLPRLPSDRQRNESMQDQRTGPQSDVGRESRTKRKSERRRDRSSDSDNAQSSRRSKDDRRRSSRKEEKPKRTDSERALDNHRASMVENQFPGEFPSTFAEPYRPPGLAADYYGDHGESVASQPGVRPVPPSIVMAADQAHLHEATVEAAPPPEPSSLGQVGAAASFYGGTSDFESDPPPRPSTNGKRPSLKPSRPSTGAANLRSSPDPEGRPGPLPYSAMGPGPAAPAGAAPVVGHAAEYFSPQFNPDLSEGGANATASAYETGARRPPTTPGVQNSAPGTIRPPRSEQRPSSGSNIPMYGAAAAAAGMAAVGAGAYYAGHHTTEQHHAMDNAAAATYGLQNTGPIPSGPQSYQSQPSTQQRRRRKGPLSTIVDFFQDPRAVAEYEAYTEAIGVCKYCFEPGSSPRDAPRKHHYNRRATDARFGSSTRVDKLNRYQSSEDEKRKRSSGKKWVATGLAGYGIAQMSEAATNRKNDFDDTYSVKSGRPEGLNRVSFAAEERVSRSRRPTQDDRARPPRDSRRDNETIVRKDKKTGELYEEKVPRRRRESSPSNRLATGATIGAGVLAAGLASAAGRQSRSKSPKKRYYSKRVSPNHSFVDLSATAAGGLGFGSFFSSPSANQRKGKKPKGLGFFNFTNASSSSSDADLAFGAGSVRRKKGRRDDRKGRDNDHVPDEILGLAATGVALAAEGQRQDRKGKRRADLLVGKEPRSDPSRRHDQRRRHSSASGSDPGNDDWIDASDDESSVDSALAYGGRLSARQSRESLTSDDGTEKWAWRWNNGKRLPKKSSQDMSRVDPVVAGLAGATMGAVATSSGRFGPAASTASGQSLQQLDPIPLSDTSAFVIDRKTSAISPRTEIPPRIFPAPMAPAPLEHPQPVAPISSAMYSRQASAPDGPPVFSQYPPQPPPAPLSESPKQLPGGYEAQRPHQAGKPSRRRNSSPTQSPVPGGEFGDDKSRRRASTRDSVKFDLTEDQAERDRRAQARRRSRRDDRKQEKQGDDANGQHEASLERERDEISSSRRDSTDARTARELEIEKELERLYEEDRRQREAQKSKRADTWPAVTATAIGVGIAGVAAMAAAQAPSPEDEPRGDREERQSRRKSAMKKTTTSPAVDDDRSDSQQRRIARMAAARVKATSSPVHEDYASYFVPSELAETVQEHNFAAEHRDDPVQELAQIVEVAPRTGRRKDTFDPFLYRPFGIEPEDDPRRHPWPVPLLDIIEPTPPVSVRGDMSPRPAQEPEGPEVPEGPEISEVAPARTQQRSPSVTWGEHQTHEYEVVTPLEDHEDFVRTPTSQSSQPANDLAETTHADVNTERSEPVTVAGHTNGVPLSSGQNDVPPPPDVVKEPQPPSDYGHDIEFAAVLAAATEGAGFDPSIVVDDPTYHRRDSPPGSGGLSSYRAPYAETASDLGTFHDYSLPPQRGFVEGSLPPTPADEVSQEALEAAHRQQSQAPAEEEQFEVEPKIPGGFSVFNYLDGATAETVKSVNNTPTEKPVIASVAEEEEKRPKESNGLPEPYAPGAESARSPAIEPLSSEKLTRSSTLDEVKFETALAESDQHVSYASDPEGFQAKPRSKKKVSNQGDRGTEAVIVGAAAAAIPTIDELVGRDRRRRKLEREEDDYYDRVPPVSVSEPGANTSGDSKKSRRRSKRDSETWDDAKSVASSPAEMKDDRESGKKSKKKGKRDGDGPDDDTMSVSSLPADLNGDRASSRKSKEKKSGGLFGLFSSSKSDTSSPQKRSSKDMDRYGRNGRDPKSEDLDEPKRKSKRKSTDKDLDDPPSDLQRSRGDSTPSAKEGARQQSPEDEFLSSEEVVQDHERTEDSMSFLGERPEMPTVLDGASGPTPKAHLEAEQGIAAQLPLVVSDPVPSAGRSRSLSPRTIPAPGEDHELPPNESSSPSTQRDQFRQRHLAEIWTSDMFPSPLATSSPTAVPLQFRRLPGSPGFARSASVGSTAADSPMSPLVTPRSRQGRPTSTEFRNSREFRPLYLVERHSSIKQPEPEIEETYPSLPSSRTSSAHPSMENLRGEDQSEYFAEKQLSLSQLHDRGRNFSYWRDERPASPDYLDSATVTPTATEFPKEVRRERPKGEFHSPSELLEDPSRQLAESQEHQSPLLSPIVLPSVGSPASSVAKHDSTSPPIEPPSPAQDQPPADHQTWGSGIGLGLGLAGTAASALLTSQLAGHEETAAATPDEAAPKADHPQELPLPSTVSATQLVENATLTDPVVSPAIEVASTTSPTDDDVALPPVPRQKRRKDKKKLKTQDLADESVEASSRGVGDKVANVDSLAASSSAEPVSAPEANVRNLSSDITAPSVSFPQEPEHDILDVQAPAQRTAVEVEHPGYFATKHDDMQAFLEPAIGGEIPVVAQEMTNPATPEEAPSQKTEDQVTFDTTKSIMDEEETTTAGQTDAPVVHAPAPEEADTSSQEKATGDSIHTPDKDLIAPETPSLPEEKIEAPILSARELVPAMPAQQDLNLSLNSALGVVDDTDHTEGHDQKASHDSFPVDESVAAPAVGAAQLPRTSALEEALAKAEAARGTGPEVSQEEVFEAFRPRVALEPPFGHGRLDTIIEGSREGSNVDLAQVDAAVEKSSEDPVTLSTAKSDTDMKTEGDATKAREAEPFVAEPEEISQAEIEAPKSEEAATTKDPVATVTPVKAVTILDPSINPFGDDYVLDKAGGIDNKAVTTSPELNETDLVQPEGASAAATPLGSPAQTSSTVQDLNEPIEELSWAQTSKKDKKGKKGRTSTLISEASTPVTEMSSTESIDPPTGRQLDIDTNPIATKKSKKSKKKGQALDRTAEDSTLVQEDAIKQAEEPLEKAGEIKPDSAEPVRADDLPVPGGKKAKKNKKGRQALGLTDEVVTPYTEESIDTATESQPNTRTVEAVTEDLARATTKKAKKNKKGRQALDLTDEAVTPQTEESIDTATESQPNARTVEAVTEDLAWATTKKVKKNKKGRQALDLTDEAVTPQTEESIDTATESQPNARTVEAVTKDLAWPTTKKGKKDQRKVKKSALLDKTTPESDVATEVETTPASVPVEEQASAVNDESPVSVPVAGHNVQWPGDEPSMPGAFGGVSVPLNEAPIPRDEPSLPSSEMLTTQTEATPPLNEVKVPEHDLHSSTPAEGSQFSAPEPHDRQVPDVAAPSQSVVPTLHETRVSELVEANLSSGPEQHGPQEPDTAMAEEVSKPQDPDEVSDSHEAPLQPQEREEAQRLPGSSGDREVSTVRDLHRVPEPSNVPQPAVDVGEDRSASTLRDSRWALVFGELQQRKLSQPTSEDRQTLATPNIEQETQPSVPAEIIYQTDMPGEKIETVMATDTRLDPDHLHPQTEKLSREQMTENKVGATADDLQADQQAHHVAPEEQASNIGPQTAPVAQVVHSRIQEEAQPVTVERSESHSISQSVMEVDDSRNQIREGSQPIIGEKPESHPVSRSVTEVQDGRDQMGEESQPIVIKEPESHPISEPITGVRDIQDPIGEESQPIAIKDPESHPISKPITEVQDIQDPIGEESQPIVVKDPESHPISEPITEVQDIRDQMDEESPPIVVQKPESHPISESITEVQDIRDHMGEESQPKIIEEPESHTISESIREVQDIQDQMGEESQPKIIEERESHTISESVREVQDIQDQMGEESQPKIIEESESHPVSEPVMEVQDIRDQMGEESQPVTAEKPESHSISEPVMEVQDTQNQTRAEAQTIIIEEPESHPVSEPVMQVQDIGKQTHEEPQPIIVDEPESQPISESVMEVQDIRDQIPEEAHQKASEEIASQTIVQPVSVAQNLHDQTQEQARGPGLEELASHTVSQPVVVAQDIHDQRHEQAQHGTTEESASNTPSKPVTTVSDMHDQTYEEAQDTIVEPTEAQEMHDQVSGQDQHTMQESRIENLAEGQDVILTNDREVSAHRPDPETHEAAESENATQLKQPEEEKPADQFPAPAPSAEEQVHEFSSAPPKRGKKDKKKFKNRRSTFDENVEPSSDSSRAKDIIPGSTTAGAATNSEIETPPVPTNVEEASGEADVFSWAPSKQSKKDKKRKKPLGSAEDTSTPASDGVGEDRSIIPEPASLASDTPAEKSISEETEVAEDAHAKDEIRSQMEALSSLPRETDNQLLISEKADQHQTVLPPDEPIPEYSEHHKAQMPGDEILVAEPAPTQEESIISKGEPAAVQEGPKDDSLTTTSKKKGKKDKEKRGSTLETSGATTPQTEDEPLLGNDSVDSAVPLMAESAKKNEWGFQTKKSKEKKKKKNKTAFSALEGQVEPAPKEGLQASPDTIKGNDAEIDRDAVERIQADVSATSTAGQDSGERTVKSPAPELAEVKGHVSTPESEPVLGIPEKGSIADQLEEQPVVTEGPNLVEESILEHKPTAATKEESSWPPALDQSKEDKPDNEHGRSTADPGESLEEIGPSATTGLVENSETVQEHDQKDVADWGLTSGPDHAAEAEIVSESKTILEHQGSGEQERSADETIEERRQPVLPDAGIPEPTAKDDTRASLAKKSKRAKKTKPKSVVEPEEPAFGAASAAAATDLHREASENSQAEILVPGEMRAGEKAPTGFSEPSGPPDSAQDITPVAEPEQDAGGPPTKRTKKDKKKQRQSTYDESSSTPSVSGTPSEPSHTDKDIVLSTNQQEQNVLGEKLEDLEAVAPVLMAASAPSAQVAEDDFGNTGKKKSKKDGKKKKTIVPWDEENDASLEQQTETLTPVYEPESSNLGGERTDSERKESIAVPDVKGGGLDSSQALESAVVAKHSLPGAYQPFNAAESTIIEGTSSDARELVTGEHPVAAAEEDGTREPENAAKNETDSTSDAVENGKQDLDSREAPSYLSSIPEAFEGTATYEPQSLHTPDISAVQERSALPMIQEPQIALEAAPKHAAPEHDASHPGQADNIGLGIATLGSEAGTSRAISDQNLPFEEELLGQRESRHRIVQDQAVHDHENQPERAQQHSLHTLEMLPTLEASKPRPSQPTWSFANLKENTVPEHANRDSGIQVSDPSPIQAGYIQAPLRDSGYVPSPVAAASREITAQEGDAHVAAGRAPRPISPTSSSEDLRQKSYDRTLGPFESGTTREMDDPSLLPSGPRDFHHDESEAPARRHPSPVDSTTKDRSSALFNSSPSSRTDEYGVTPRLDTRHVQAPITDLHRSPSIHGHRSGEELRALTPSRSPSRRFRPLSDAPNALSMQEASQKQHNYVLGPFPTGDGHDRDLSPPRTPLQTIHEHLADTSHSNRRRRPLSKVGSPDRGHESAQRLGGPAARELDSRREADPPGHASDPQTPPRQPRTSEAEREFRTPAVGDHGRDLAEVGGVAALSAATVLAAEELRPSSRDMTPEDAKSLGKSKSRSTSSKQLRQNQTSLENIASSSTHDPVREKGKAAARDMAEVYNGYGEFPGAPMSPTRPPSVRSRRSMQQLKDLEARLDQLVAENRSLATAKISAEQQLQDLHIAQSRTEHASQEALELRDLALREKDEAIAKMREMLEAVQKEVARLTEVNEGLTATHDELRSVHEQRYSHLEQQHAESHQLWQESSRELEGLRSKHEELSTGMEEIVERELDTRLAEKDAEIQRLHDELEDAKAKIRELQQQILVGQSDEIIVARDEDYFDNACQQLCQHVQQWVLRFSKFSDTRGCRLTNEVRDEKVVDRFENAILDGSDVDLYLVDRVRRRDVFMSVVMTMIWDYIFTRYLFGMDREQRQKLKLLEKNLSEVGPQSAVHRWRAMTLTLLSKRPSFRAQRASDTEAVVQEIYDTLARFLPPPQHLQGQIQESLRNVMKTAVDLSIEMRTQRAEYIMLPPLQPEYDTNGDLARQVYFNAALMNERSGQTTSNEELEDQQAVVQMVLFPLVVKKGSDSGEGDEEIVVCPAQVLVARPRKDKSVVKTVSGDRMSMDQANRSVQSFAPSVLDPTNVI